MANKSIDLNLTRSILHGQREVLQQHLLGFAE